MWTRFFVIAIVSSGGAACSGSSAPVDAGPTDAPAADAPDGASVLDAGDGGGTTDAGATDLGAGDTGVADSGAPDAGPPDVVLTLDHFTLAPGAEANKCQDFASPLGADFDVAEFESHGSAGMLMVVLYERPVATDGPLVDCPGLELSTLHYASEQLDGDLRYPAGVAAHVSGANGFRVYVHYDSESATDTDVSTSVVLHVADSSTVTSKAGMLFAIEPSISIAPMSMRTVTHDCTLPVAMNLLSASSVMFQHGTSFSATVGGSAVYDTTEWRNPVPAVLAPPVVAPAGTALHFACSYDNLSGATVMFGSSAMLDEQCIFFAPFSGVADGASPTVSCP